MATVEEHPGEPEPAPPAAPAPPAPRTPPPTAVPLDRRLLGWEVWLVLLLSLLGPTVSAVISLAGALTAPEGLAEQEANLIVSYAERPWLDLAYQLRVLAFGFVPVLLALYLLRRGGGSARSIGFDLRRPGRDLAVGALAAALVGTGGLAVYLAAQATGLGVTVVPSTLQQAWWQLPVLLGQAVKNGVLEEVIVVGYLLLRLDQLGWSPARAVAASALLRGCYHLYQGFGMFFGNIVMGLAFGWFYHRYGRVMPLVVAHTLIDAVAFVGSAYLIGRVDWLPGA
ncbi:CPBP family intramembrane glutamic endopeptidase [Allonocardiopsis opalescens]|uniref:Membrane protease YdiL (CAAX protease family) n=1 Tax=Allonocardiopsis opalescens TaxID=1144618 RepID=A0A2T0Q4H3_9ACTN|nr:CPBP family intramembrane glutamic endopeptidase [Allonocardiopsis opalescens]PRX98717.1 membrane protease YdiL (CAAX protease family) [Allonocardiopsis opalescens]